MKITKKPEVDCLTANQSHQLSNFSLHNWRHYAIEEMCMEYFISFWEFQYWKVTEKYFKRQNKNQQRSGINLTGYLDKRMKNSHEQVG